MGPAVDTIEGPPEWLCTALHGKSFKQAYVDGFQDSLLAPYRGGKRTKTTASGGSSVRVLRVLLCTGNTVIHNGKHTQPLVLAVGELDVTELETKSLTPLLLEGSAEEAFDVAETVMVTITHAYMAEFRSMVSGEEGYLNKPLLFGGLTDLPAAVPMHRGEVLDLDGDEVQRMVNHTKTV